jgi:hypothetical protein
MPNLSEVHTHLRLILPNGIRIDSGWGFPDRELLRLIALVAEQ